MNHNVKASRGRPKYQPSGDDRERVKMMAGMGITEDDIAKVVGVSAPTLRRAFRAELDIGHITATTAVAQSLYRQATSKDKPNVVAAIFWMKCRAGWKEAAAIEREVVRQEGKKAVRTEKARGVAHGKFAPGSTPSTPKLVVNNDS